jgi:hypothetical protein
MFPLPACGERIKVRGSFLCYAGRTNFANTA